MAIYYVSNSLGNDANNGTTTLTPWKSIAKVNTASLNLTMFDRVEFRRGDSWSGTALRPKAGGGISNYITFSAYGSGARPIISSGAAFTSMIQDATIAYLRFENIDFSGSTGANYSTVMSNGHDIDMYECIFRDGAYMGFIAFSEAGEMQYNVSVRHCYAYNNHNSGICITSNTGLYGPSTGNLVEYCLAHDNGSTLFLDHGIYCRYGGTIRYNECYNQPFGGGIKVNSQLNESSWNPIVYGNKLHDNFNGIICDGFEALIYNNLIYNNDWNVSLSSGSKDILFAFNTILNAAQSTGVAYGLREFNAAQNFSGSTIINNLIIQDRTVSPNYIWRTTGTGRMDYIAANNVINYNVVYTDALVGTDIFYDAVALGFNWTEWKAYAGLPDANSTFLLALPDVGARYTDLSLPVGSNIYGKGIAVAGITTDKFGTLRPNPPSPGWFDIADPVGPPGLAGSFANLGRMVSFRGLKANIEAGSAELEEVRLAIATDTGQLGIYSNGVWRWIMIN